MIDQDLWRRIKAGDEAAKEQIIIEIFPLVRRVSTKMWRSLPPHVDVNDIISYGSLGLMRAIANFDPTMGVPFESYAATSVRSLILDELRAEDWAPRSLRRRQREIDAAREKLLSIMDRQPTKQEIADELGCPVQDVVSVLSRTEASYHKSLDEGDPERDWGTEDKEDPNSELSTESDRTRVAMAALIDEIRRMPALDQVVLALRYFRGMKLAQVGALLGITETKASQVHSRAVVRVKELLQALLAEGTRL